MATYEELLALKPAAPEDLLLRLARAASNAGNRARALTAYQTLYYDWPTGEAATAAAKEMSERARAARAWQRAVRARAGPRGAAVRGPPVHACPRGLQALQPQRRATSELVPLRLAECDYFLRRLRGLREDLRPFLDGSARRAEARYFDLMTRAGAGPA